MKWTDAMVERVRALVKLNLSASQIARDLNQMLDANLTRNSIISITHRKGITGRTVTRDEQAERAKSNGHAARKRERIRAAQMSVPPPSVVAPVPMPDPLPARTTVSRRCSLMDLTSSTCRFPIGEVGADDFAFCGEQPVGALPYCAGHARLCYSPAYATKRSARL